MIRHIVTLRGWSFPILETMSFLSSRLFQFSARRSLTTMSSFSPLNVCMFRSPVSQVNNSIATGSSSSAMPSYLSSLFGLTQKRWKSRGNTYQPSTLKRKRRVGFLARVKSKQGSKILKRRREKGRWYLTH